MSIIYNPADIGDASDIESMEQQAGDEPVLHDTVALVRTPEQMDDLDLGLEDHDTQQTSSPNARHALSQYADSQHALSQYADSQQSLESLPEAKKSGRMNRLITKLRHHKRD